METIGYYKTPIGLLCAKTNGGRLTGLSLTDTPILPSCADTPLFENLQQALDAYFAGCRNAFDAIPLQIQGSTFEAAVWEALRTIPFGETRTYGEVAAMIGTPGAARAVGGACHRNPLLLVVPCHRVIGRGGSLTGFGAGMENKILLLQHEHHIIKKERLIQ